MYGCLSEIGLWLSLVRVACLCLIVCVTLVVGVMIQEFLTNLYCDKIPNHLVLYLSLYPYRGDILRFNCTNFIFCNELTGEGFGILSNLSP